MQCYKTNKDDIEGRLDCEFYKPEYMALEKKVRPLKTSLLRDYVKNLAGGATPNRDEEEKYYTIDANEGIPFIRVQNISEDGLNFNNLKYIKPETHENMLKRSQVKEGDLITKITGVGRMAISAIAPRGFVGNINQHSVVIKTESEEISEYLATYLNLDFVEKLAKRRSTGGTRPALDYTALQTIPVIYKPEIVPLMKEAYAKKQQKEQEAENLLNSIEDFVLKKLGIELPEIENKMCFKVMATDIKNSRLDTFYHQESFNKINSALSKSKYGVKTLGNVSEAFKTGTTPHQDLNPFTENEEVVFLRNSDLQNGIISLGNVKYIKNELADKLTYSFQNELIICIAGTIGTSAINNIENKIAINQNITSIKLKENINANYIALFLNLKLCESLFNRVASLATIKYINNENLKTIPIILPPIDIQNLIVEEYQKISQKAQQLQQEAQEEFEQAKENVEKIILGGIDFEI